MEIGVLISQNWKNKISELEFLRKAFEKRGESYKEIILEEPNIEERVKGCDCVLTNYVWGYHERISEYLECIKIVAKNTTLINSYRIIIDNFDKCKQFEYLKAAKIPIVDTIFVTQNYSSDWFKCIRPEADTIRQIQNIWSCKEVVIKPNISAGGYRTYLVSNNSKLKGSILPEKADEMIRTVGDESGVCILQKYIPEIKDGEFALVYFSDGYSHTILRYPAIFHEKILSKRIKSVPKSVMELGNRVYELYRHNITYMRVDIVLHKEMPYVMEVEVIEPDLFLRYLDEDAEYVIDRFIAEIYRCIRK